jgi:hypothetical protein
MAESKRNNGDCLIEHDCTGDAKSGRRKSGWLYYSLIWVGDASERKASVSSPPWATMSSGDNVGYITASGMFKCAEGELTEAEVVASRRNFRAYDIDGDGVISRQDFEGAMLKYDSMWSDASKKGELDEMYAAVDIDGTGRVDFLKFAAMRVRKKSELASAANRSNPSENVKSKRWPSKRTNGDDASAQKGNVLDVINPFSKVGVCFCFSPRANDQKLQQSKSN